MADGGAAHQHRGDDEQRDLQQRQETGGSGEGRHVWIAEGSRSAWRNHAYLAGPYL